MTENNPRAMSYSYIYDRDSIKIKEVYAANLDTEFDFIRNIVDDYPYVAMDTEFPGELHTVDKESRRNPELVYSTLKDNVNALKLIQLGLTFFNVNGGLPTCGTDKLCIWQFNFREFNPDYDQGASDSVALLRKNGIDFNKNNETGIDANRFGELLMSSGAVLNDDVTWVTFHGKSDFGYLIKLLTGKQIPETRDEFLELFHTFFPTSYDVNQMIKSHQYGRYLRGGLKSVPGMLGLKRVGVAHEAASDSLLASCLFRKVKHQWYQGSVEEHAGVLFELGPRNAEPVN